MQLATSSNSHRCLWGRRKYRTVTIGKKARNDRELKSIYVRPDFGDIELAR
jgi:hypothetical protein